ncbi:MAG TPA: lysophospholipid acyltransferase family protein [Opitutaceae bacterium]|nr:lysophospholipid acyltransferase family protein [Opitutaceae bacterium]
MLKRFYQVPAYALGWLTFGVCALAFNFLCAVLLLLPGRETWGRFARATLHLFFAAWLRWLRLLGVLRVQWHGFESVPFKKPAVWVANHPGLLDATFLLACVPDVICVFKPAMLRNPFLAPAAIVAGYAAGEYGPDFIRESVRKLSEGRSVLIFPEGTRTSLDRSLNPLKSGFALIAERARVPVRVVVIHASRDLLPRGKPWWLVPRLPAFAEVQFDSSITVDPDSAREATARVEARLQEVLRAPAQAMTV